MSCVNQGPWHLGISNEACENAGGTYFRTPCVSLQACIAGRPAVDDPGFSQTFEGEFVDDKIPKYDIFLHIRVN